jgi:hypothetical protein
MKKGKGLDPLAKHVLEPGEEAICPECGRGKNEMLAGCRYCGWLSDRDRLDLLLAYRASMQYQRDLGLDEQTAFVELRKLGDRIADGEIPDLPVSRIVEGLKRTGYYKLYRGMTEDKIILQRIAFFIVIALSILNAWLAAGRFQP